MQVLILVCIIPIIPNNSLKVKHSEADCAKNLVLCCWLFD